MVERLDRYDAAEGVWCEALVEDRQAGPAETAAARIDVGDWLGLLSSRDRRIATALAAGGTTGEVAMAFRLTPGRVSQMRREYMESWREFQGEEERREGEPLAIAVV